MSCLNHNTAAPALRPNHSTASLECSFLPVSLHELDSRAALRVRRDNKYIVPAAVVEQLAPLLAGSFDMLDIEGRRAFRYDTCYFDDASYSSYLDHLHGRRRRVKVRVRHYVETDHAFLEVKLKDGRGGTVKRRLPHDPKQLRHLDTAALRFVEDVQLDLYGRAVLCPLQPALRVSYQRLQLVARGGSERLTLDRHLQFSCGPPIGTDRFIVEVKSARGHGLADRLLRQWHQHPVKGCSKYCVGLSLTGAVDRFNRFRPALRRLGALDLARATRPSDPCGDPHPFAPVLEIPCTT